MIYYLDKNHVEFPDPHDADDDEDDDEDEEDDD